MFDNPFPGVDPFVEDQYYWNDFRASFILSMAGMVREGLPEGYDARVDERETFVDPYELGWLSRPTATDSPALSRSADSPRVEDDEPSESVRSRFAGLCRERERFLKIVRLPERELVTVVEFLSPENKVGLGFMNAQARRDLLLSRRQLNLVEIDLLATGCRGTFGADIPRGHSLAIVAPAYEKPQAIQVYDWSIRDPLPTIWLPLRKPGAGISFELPGIALDLAAIYAEAYKRGRYAKSIDRRQPLNLPLSPEDVAWAEKIAAEQEHLVR